MSTNAEKQIRTALRELVDALGQKEGGPMWEDSLIMASRSIENARAAGLAINKK